MNNASSFVAVLTDIALTYDRVERPIVEGISPERFRADKKQVEKILETFENPTILFDGRDLYVNSADDIEQIKQELEAVVDKLWSLNIKKIVPPPSRWPAPHNFIGIPSVVENLPIPCYIDDVSFDWRSPLWPTLGVHA